MVNIPKEKKEVLIEVMIDEYSQKGYTNASTNVIVKKAGISKGSLFNYVGNKQDQYFLLIEYLMGFLIEKLEEYSHEYEFGDDYFENLLIRSQIKVKLSMEYPKEFKLLMDAYMEKDDSVKAFMKKQGSIFAKNKLFRDENILDPNLLIDPSSAAKISKMVYYLIAGYSESYLKINAEKTNNPTLLMEEMTEELKSYFDVLKKGLFKEGEKSDDFQC